MDAATVDNSRWGADDGIPGTPAGYRRYGRAGLVDPDVTSEERMWATFIHLGGTFSYFLVPLILWLIKRDESAFVDDHGKEALNFYISMLVWGVLGALSMVCFIGFVIVPVLGVVQFVCGIVNAFRAHRGEYVRYPITIRFIT